MDGIIVALAGVRRVGLEKEITEVLPFEWMLPAVGQGVIALLIRKEDEAMKERVGKVNDPRTYDEMQVERTFLEKLGGGCHVPIAGVAQLDEAGGVMTLRGGVFSLDGKQSLKAKLSAPRCEAVQMAERVAGMLLIQGANKLLSTRIPKDQG
jgi:hydroxymethylbilane synthase